jgi:hypothetical protein
MRTPERPTAGARSDHERSATVMEVDWCHCDGTKIHATIKIQHCYNLNKDLAPTFDSFCVSLRTLLVPQDPPGFTPRRTPD